MTIAFLYAGQGSQKEHMGEDFYNAFPQIRDRIDNKSAGMDIKDLCFNAPLTQLSQTRYTQPCMAAFAACVTDLLFEKGIKPDYTAGLSLGEYSALYAAGVFDEDTLLDVLAFRGKVMEATTSGMATKMMAILGLSAEGVNEAVNKAAAMGKGVVACANFNCKGQTVIGGELAAVELAGEYCMEAGAKRCIPLNVSAPFHTPLMEEAANLMHDKLATVDCHEMKVPVIFNTTADLIHDGETVQELLETQVKSPVLFEKSIMKLAELGVDTIIEIGPGSALSGFVKKTAPQIKTYVIEDVPSLEKTLLALGA